MKTETMRKKKDRQKERKEEDRSEKNKTFTTVASANIPIVVFDLHVTHMLIHAKTSVPWTLTFGLEIVQQKVSEGGNCLGRIE